MKRGPIVPIVGAIPSRANERVTDMDVAVETREAIGVVPADWWYESPLHTEALARLEFVVDRGWAGADLVGPPGTGKTLVADRLVDGLRRGGTHAIRLDVGFAGTGDLVSAVLESLRTPIGHRPHGAALRDACAALVSTRTRAVVVCDHVDTPELREAVGRLRRSCGDALTLVAVGRTPIEEEGLRIELAPWDVVETGRFLSAIGHVAGRSFSADTVESLFASSNGRPDRLRRQVELALVADAAGGEHLSPAVARGIVAEFRAG